MPHFKSINFCQKFQPKIQLFLPKKYKIFERWGCARRFPCLQRMGALLSNLQSSAKGGCAHRPSKHPSPLYISGYASESNHVLALLVSSHGLKALIVIKISLKLSYFCKTIQILLGQGAPTHTPQTPLFRLQMSGYVRDTRRMLLSYFQVLESYNKKFLSESNNNRYLH